MNSHTEPKSKVVQGFFEAIESCAPAYAVDVFAFVGVKHNDVFTLVQGRVIMQPVPVEFTPVLVQTEHILAGRCRVVDLGLNTRELIDAAVSGSVPTTGGTLSFLPDYAGDHGACRKL